MAEAAIVAIGVSVGLCRLIGMHAGLRLHMVLVLMARLHLVRMRCASALGAA